MISPVPAISSAFPRDSRRFFSSKVSSVHIHPSTPVEFAAASPASCVLLSSPTSREEYEGDRHRVSSAAAAFPPAFGGSFDDCRFREPSANNACSSSGPAFDPPFVWPDAVFKNTSNTVKHRQSVKSTVTYCRLEHRDSCVEPSAGSRMT